MRLNQPEQRGNIYRLSLHEATTRLAERVCETYVFVGSFSPTSSTPSPSPVFGEVSHKDETWDQFEGRLEAHEDAVIAWVKAEALREFRQAGQGGSSTTPAERFGYWIGYWGIKIGILAAFGARIRPEAATRGT